MELTLNDNIISYTDITRLSIAPCSDHLPKMGSTPIHKVNAVTTIEIIQPLADDEKLETDKKVCRWINEIMVYAVNTGVIHANPLAGIGKAFNALMGLKK